MGRADKKKSDLQKTRQRSSYYDLTKVRQSTSTAPLSLSCNDSEPHSEPRSCSPSSKMYWQHLPPVTVYSATNACFGKISNQETVRQYEMSLLANAF
jgi:hypothetical protein